MPRLRIAIKLLCMAAALAAAAMPLSAQPANDGAGAYKTGKYRNLFAEDGHSAAEIQAKIDAAYRIQKFFVAQGISKYGPVYSLDGKDLGSTPGLTHEDHPAGLAGTNAVAGLAATDRARARQFTEALWNTPIPSGENRYYDGMLYMMSLMHLGGQFRIWSPQ